VKLSALLRRRWHPVAVLVLVLVTAGWLWQAGFGPRTRAGAPSHHPAAAVERLIAAPTSDARVGASPPAASSHAPTLSPLAFTGPGTGRLRVVPGTSPLSGTGPVKRYLVEIEDGLAGDDDAFADFVERTLGDRRSWTHPGGLSLQRVDSEPVDFRVTLASPDTVDRYCAPLDTNGYTSCYDGKGRALLNVLRWMTGVPWYVDQMTTYRQYMVNHEVGHALGHGHEHCPAAGALAPVMQQQTLGLQGCRRNAWSYP